MYALKRPNQHGAAWRSFFQGWQSLFSPVDALHVSFRVLIKPVDPKAAAERIARQDRKIRGGAL